MKKNNKVKNVGLQKLMFYFNDQIIKTSVKNYLD